MKNHYKQQPHVLAGDGGPGMSNSRGAKSPGRSSSDVGGAQGAICVKNRGGRFCCFFL